MNGHEPEDEYLPEVWSWTSVSICESVSEDRVSTLKCTWSGSLDLVIMTLNQSSCSFFSQTSWGHVTPVNLLHLAPNLRTSLKYPPSVLLHFLLMSFIHDAGCWLDFLPHFLFSGSQSNSFVYSAASVLKHDDWKLVSVVKVRRQMVWCSDQGCRRH